MILLTICSIIISYHSFYNGLHPKHRKHRKQ